MLTQRTAPPGYYQTLKGPSERKAPQVFEVLKVTAGGVVDVDNLRKAAAETGTDVYRTPACILLKEWKDE